MLDNIIFLGTPGCGKGTQAGLLKKKIGYLHLSTGDLFRKSANEKDELGKKIQYFLVSGDLVPDEVVNDVIKEFYIENLNKKGVILDGYPRNIHQAKLLETLLDTYKLQISKVFYFDIEDEVVIKRITGRFSCSECGAIYNSYFNTTKVVNECDVCHSHSFKKRSDDTEEVIKHRLDVFKNSTAPLFDFYKDKLVKINAGQSLESVTAEILGNL